MDTMALQSDWDTLWERFSHQYNIILSASKKGVKRLCKSYQGRGRHYHNLSHIKAMLGLLNTYQNHLRAPDTVALAIWYHDAVYSSLRKDNEHRSAKWAKRDLLTWGMPEDVVSTVVTMIETTAHHHQIPEPINHDLLWFLDFDLNILATSSTVYAQYVEQVRKEYRLIPEGLYRQGRVKVLKTFLAHDFIYHTPIFRQEKERKARENLITEIAYWENLQ